MKNKNNILIVLSSIVIILVVYNFSNFSRFQNMSEKVTYSTFLETVKAGKVSKVILHNNKIKILYKDKKTATTVFPLIDVNLISILKKSNVEIEVMDTEYKETGATSWFLILGIILLVWFILSRKKNKSSDSSGGGIGGLGGGNNPFSFGKSKAKAVDPKDIKVSFKDVAGINEAKEELEEIVDFLHNPEKYHNIGAKVPKGCLLIGAPGTGKTLIAKAVASEANVPFLYISGSDFVEMFVGVGASRVRDMFAQAKKIKKCIIFIDEIDAVGRHRGVGMGGGNDEREQTLNQLLVEMDGFTENESIIVLAATNRADVLDKALLRPGRFDRKIHINYPDSIGREQIFRVHIKTRNIDKDVDVSILAKSTIGFTGADIANMVNEGALIAASRGEVVITMHHLNEARDKIIMGRERKSMRLTEEDKLLTAYHEAGHALLALSVKDYHDVHKVTIIPRGRAMGVTSFLPTKDHNNYTYNQLIAQLIVLYGGRVVEEVIYGEQNITTGASSDISVATDLAYRMVSEWGFGSLGPIKYNLYGTNGHMTEGQNLRLTSEETFNKLDSEVKELINSSYKKATDLIKEQMESLEIIKDALMEYETISGEEVKLLISKEKNISNLRS